MILEEIELIQKKTPKTLLINIEKSDKILHP